MLKQNDSQINFQLQRISKRVCLKIVNVKTVKSKSELFYEKTNRIEKVRSFGFGYYKSKYVSYTEAVKSSLEGSTIGFIFKTTVLYISVVNTFIRFNTHNPSYTSNILSAIQILVIPNLFLTPYIQLKIRSLSKIHTVRLVESLLKNNVHGL